MYASQLASLDLTRFKDLVGQMVTARLNNEKYIKVKDLSDDDKKVLEHFGYFIKVSYADTQYNQREKSGYRIYWRDPELGQRN